MSRSGRFRAGVCVLGVLLTAVCPVLAVPQQPAKARISKLNLTGLKTLPAEKILPETGLKLGDLAGRDELQAAADRLVQLGVLSKVTYEFATLPEGLTVNFRLEEAPRVPVFFDNVPWFTDAELAEAIRKTVPFYDGTAPEDGSVLERIADALRKFLETRNLRVTMAHQLVANPLGDGMVQEFHINGTALRIARVEFSDPLAGSSRTLQQHVSDLVGKPFSRMVIELFLAEHVRPVYLQQGYLRAKLGPPEIRLTGNPNQPLPEAVPVYVPVSAGVQYRWQGAQWSGIAALTTALLDERFEMKPGEVANGLAIEAAWERIREEYGHEGYLDVLLDAQPAYNEQARTIAYRVTVEEGPQYSYSGLVITGLSIAAERRVRAAWTITGGAVFDKMKFEEILTKLQWRRQEIFGDLPVHYTEVGHWLKTDPQTKSVAVLLDFK